MSGNAKRSFLICLLLQLIALSSGMALQRSRLSQQRSTRGSRESNKKLFFRPDDNAVPREVFGAGLIQTLDSGSTRFKTPQSHVRYRFSDQVELPPRSTQPAWKAAVQSISNFASLLCVLDCTLLPIITLLFPLLNMAIPLESLHQLGHSIAIYFVLPVGALTAFLNFGSHRRVRLASFSVLGLILIAVANSHAIPVHWLHHGWGHKLTNVVGCVTLLTSNYMSRQLVGHKNCDC